MRRNLSITSMGLSVSAVLAACLEFRFSNDLQTIARSPLCHREIWYWLGHHQRDPRIRFLADATG